MPWTTNGIHCIINPLLPFIPHSYITCPILHSDFHLTARPHPCQGPKTPSSASLPPIISSTEGSTKSPCGILLRITSSETQWFSYTVRYTLPSGSFIPNQLYPGRSETDSRQIITSYHGIESTQNHCPTVPISEWPEVTFAMILPRCCNYRDFTQKRYPGSSAWYSWHQKIFI